MDIIKNISKNEGPGTDSIGNMALNNKPTTGITRITEIANAILQTQTLSSALEVIHKSINQ